MADEGKMAMQASGNSSAAEIGEKWGDDIRPERKAWLEERLHAWVNKADHGMKRGPFDGERLTGANVFWLAARLLAGSADEVSIRDAVKRLQDHSFVPDLPLEGADLSRAHLEGAMLQEARLDGASLQGAQLEGASLGSAHLEGADLSEYLEIGRLWPTHLESVILDEAHLEGASLWEAHLEGASLREAHLEGASLNSAHLEGASLNSAHLEGASLNSAHLEGASLWEAHLEGADLRLSHLEGADLRQAHLEGAMLQEAHLEGRRYNESDKDRLQYIRQAMERGIVLVLQNFFGTAREEGSFFPNPLPPADLRLAFFDRATQLKGTTLGDADLGFVRVADTLWGEVNLAVVDWPEKPILRDELESRTWTPKPFQPKSNDKRSVRQQLREWREQQQTKRLDHYRAAARAYRQVATKLRDQGLNDEADRFAYRANLLQRAVLVRQRAWGRAFFSGLLDLVAGYGYRPRRSVVTYVVTIAIFAVLYWCVTNDVSLTHGLFTYAITWLGMTPPPTSHEHLQGYEAVVVSMTSFHGRGFFQPVQSPGDRVAILAAIEAAIGLLIEITFIATFTQRFFAR